nr:immunoglobulin light chain junction region [Macaca mulatta]
CLQYTSSPFTF